VREGKGKGKEDGEEGDREGEGRRKLRHDCWG